MAPTNTEVDSLEDEKKEEKVKLDWRDYVAFVIALLETSLLPFILIMVALFAIAIIISIF